MLGEAQREYEKLYDLVCSQLMQNDKQKVMHQMSQRHHGKANAVVKAKGKAKCQHKKQKGDCH